MQKIALDHALAKLIGSLSENERVRDLLNISLGRVLQKTMRMENGGRLERVEEEDAKHIVDWITAAVATNERWLSNVDEFGRPKKLMKFSKVEQITAEADKAMFVFAQKNGNKVLVEGSEELFFDLENGYRLVRMLTPEALDNESSVMQHCIGQGGYDHHLKSGDRLFVSLRDVYGKAHATIEADRTGLILQLQGKQNNIPVRRYIDAMRPAFLAKVIDPRNSLERLDLFLNDKAELISKYDIPEDTVVEGSLTFNNAPSSLPARLTINGDLTMHEKVAALPAALKVRGNLTMTKSEITVIPADLEVGGVIDASGSKVALIEEGFQPRGDLKLAKTKVAGLPSGFTVPGDLDLAETPISSLPSGLRVEGDLDLTNTSVRRIPDDIVIGHSLGLESTSLEGLPEGFHVPGDLSIRYARLDTLPKMIHVGKTLDMMHTLLTEIPAAWIIDGDIEASGSKVVSIPGRTRIERNLLLSATAITSLSEIRYIGGKLDIDDTKIEYLPDDLVVEGGINAKNAPLREIPKRLVCNARLILKNTQVSELPDDWKITGPLDLSYTAVSELRAGMRIERSYIDVSNTGITALPDNFYAKDFYYASGQIKTIGAGVDITGGILHSIGGLRHENFEAFKAAVLRGEEPINMDERAAA